MNKPLYHAAKPIFDAACELPADEQLAYVAHACGTDPDLRSLVEDLLRTHRETPAQGGTLNRAIERSMTSVEDEPGLIIDRFELLERIGEGGFGTVWRAKQHEPVRRRVAIKVLKPGMDSRKIVARFKAERQALALMDHPNIAQVYDGGVTPTGRPYFAMELVDGVSVTGFCRDRELPIAARLDLFVKVCNAIQHAHQKGVIHRDIKPSNVLVTELEGKPQPKVIDFGIAKAIANEGREDTQLTELHQIIGTPEYMAPEQLDGSGRGIDTRADVYSLGVLLYELLTGSRPFEPEDRDGSLHSLLDAIRTAEPQKPSTRAATRSDAATATGTTERLHVALRGDLDWIMLRALDKDRARRYESVGSFADDIGRHLRNEPVSAGPPSKVYRLRKFVARNRVGVVAAAMVLASLIAGLVGSGMALGWALEERERADQRFNLALDAVRDYHSGVAQDVILSQPDMAPLRARLLEPPRKLYEKLAASLSVDSRPEERAALGRALQGLAALLEDVGQGKQAIATYLRATTMLEQLASESQDPTSVLFERASLLGIVGRLQVMEGDVDDAIATLQESIDATQHLLAIQPSTPAFKNHLADATAELGSAFRQRGDLDKANTSWRAALSIYQQLLQVASERTDASKDIADINNSLGRVALNSSRAEEARELFANARTMVEGLLQERPELADLISRVSTCSGNLGNACSKAGDEPAAKAAYERAIELGDKLVKRFPGIAAYRHALGNHHSALAGTCEELGELDAAANHFDRALALLNSARSTADRRLLAQALTNSGGFLLDRKDVDGAVARFRNAVAVFDSLLNETPDPDVISSAASCFNNYAGVANRNGQLDEARKLYERSIALREQVLTAYPDNFSQHLNMSTALLNLARMHFAAKRYLEAIPLCTRSMGITEELAEHFQDKPKGRWWQLHRSSYWERANSHQMSDQYRLAVNDWLRAAQIDDGKMRAPYLTQLFGDMVRGGLLGDPSVTVPDYVTRSGAVPMDLMRVGSSFLRGSGNRAFLPVALAITSNAVAMVERENPDELWRFLDLLADAQLQSGDADAAFETQQRALSTAPKDIDERFRRTLEGRMNDIRAARGK